MKIFQIQRDKTELIDLGMKKAFFFFSSYHLMFDSGKNLNSSEFPIPFSGSQEANEQRQSCVSGRKLPISVRG